MSIVESDKKSEEDLNDYEFISKYIRDDSDQDNLKKENENQVFKEKYKLTDINLDRLNNIGNSFTLLIDNLNLINNNFRKIISYKAAEEKYIEELAEREKALREIERFKDKSIKKELPKVEEEVKEKEKEVKKEPEFLNPSDDYLNSIENNNEEEENDPPEVGEDFELPEDDDDDDLDEEVESEVKELPDEDEDEEIEIT